MAGNRSVRGHVQKYISSFPLLEKGTLGRIYLATGPRGEKYSLKISFLKDATDKEEKYMVTEATNLNRLRHPHVVRYVDCWEERDPQDQLKMYLLTEFCEEGNLLTHIKARGNPDTQQFGTWLTHIASGLKYIHQMEILHRNLKTSNIMVLKQNGQFILKIGDFAMSKHLEQRSVMADSIVGTPYFMSPEIMRAIPYNKKSDIWSLGCTAFEMSTSRNIFETRTVQTLKMGLQDGTETEVRDNIRHGPFFVKLIIKMMQDDAHKRPCANEVLVELLSQGYTSEEAEDLKLSRESRKQPGRSSNDLTRDVRRLPVVPEQHQVTNMNATVPFPSGSQRGRPLSRNQNMTIRRNTDTGTRGRGKNGKDQRKANHPRTKSEGDVEHLLPVLEHFTEFQIEKKKTGTSSPEKIENYTVSSASGLSAIHGSTSGYETDESGNCLTSTASSSYLAGASELDAVDERTSPWESDNADFAVRESKLVNNIHRIQEIVVDNIGNTSVFEAAYSALGISDGNKLEKELKSILGDKYDDVFDLLIYVRRLENQLDSLKTLPRTKSLKAGKLGHTM